MHWDLQQFDEVDSTNRIAAEQALARWDAGQSAQGIAILARRQSAGRGQHGRRWESPPGGLYLSAVVENIAPEIRDRAALVAGVAVLQALDRMMPLKIRWPNDLVTNAGKKIAGILCEAVAQGDKWALVVGVGVNVQTPIGNLPPELREAATSLAAENAPAGIEELAKLILQRLDEASRLPLAAIIAVAQERDALRGRKIQIEDGGTTVTGKGAGIAANGSLMVEMPGGAIRIFDRGTVRILL